MLRGLCLLVVSLCSIFLLAAETSCVKNEGGYSTPNEVWDAYRQAMHKGRWKDAFRHLTPRSQEYCVQGFVFIAAYVRGGPDKDSAAKLKAILGKHGLDLDQIEPEAEKVTSKAEVAAYVDQLNQRVKDKEQLFHDVMSVLEPKLPWPRDKRGKRVIIWGKLTAVTVVGDTAIGKCMEKLDQNDVFEIGGVRQTEREAEIAFRKLNGRWFVEQRPE